MLLDNRVERAHLPGVNQFLHRCEIIVLMVQRRLVESPGPESLASSVRELQNVLQNVERLGTYERLAERMGRVSAAVNAFVVYLNMRVNIPAPPVGSKSLNMYNSAKNVSQ